MLVLSRRVGEIIQIGPDIQVRVVAVQGGQVRLGLEAPREVPIRRSELPPLSAQRLVANFVPTPPALEYSI